MKEKADASTGQEDADRLRPDEVVEEDVMEVEAPLAARSLKRKRGRVATKRARSSSPSSPPPPAVQAALSRTGRRPNYKEANDDDEFEVVAADDEVDAADAEVDGAEAEGGTNNDDDEERDEVFESLLILEGENEELRRKWRERVGKGVTQTHLERWFGVGNIPDDYYGLNGWLGRLPPGRILARRFINGPHTTFTVRGLDAENGAEREGSEVEACFWYLYWFRGRSYLHCRWIPEHHFMQFDDSGGRITSFNKKRTVEEAELDVSFITQPRSQQQSQGSVVTKEERNDHPTANASSSSNENHVQVQQGHEQEASTGDAESSQPPTTIAHTADQPLMSHSHPQPTDVTDSQTPQSLTQSDKDREEADLAAFLSKEDERKLARMRDIAAEREDMQRRRRLAPLFDVDWLAVDRVVDHRRKRRERGKRKVDNGENTRKERVEERIEDYQRAMHASAMNFIRAMQQPQQNRADSNMSEGDVDVTAEDKVGAEPDAMEEEKMEADAEEADEDEDDAPLAASRGRVEYEFLVKWKKLSYDQCTWETFSFLSAAHIDGPQLATPLASPDAASSSPSSSPYLSAVQSYLAFVSRAAVRPASWIIPQSKQARAAETRRERERLRKLKVEEKKRRAEERRSAREQESLNGEQMSDIHNLHDDLKLNLPDEDGLSASHSSDTDDDEVNSTRAPSSPSPPPSSANLSALSSRPPVTSSMRFGPSGLSLRPYQVDGVNWIVLNWLTGRNSILADEMGLGPTCSSPHRS